MARAATAAAPRIQVGAPEVELASRTILLRRDRALCRELTQRIPVNTEVLRCVARVEPFVPSASVLWVSLAQ
jgi:hypothetical protein